MKNKGCMFRLKMLSHQPQLQKYKRVFPSCCAISCQAYSLPSTDKTSFVEMILQKLVVAAFHVCLVHVVFFCVLLSYLYVWSCYVFVLY
jgi:hypothetical protein